MRAQPVVLLSTWISLVALGCAPETTTDSTSSSDGSTTASSSSAQGGAGNSTSDSSGVGGVGGSTSAGDHSAPAVTITSPAPNTATQEVTVTLEGTASDPSGVAVVNVAGVDATTTDGFAHFNAEVPLQPGLNTLVIAASDSIGNADPAAATLDVYRVIDGAPTILETFPPAWAGVEAPGTTVYVRVSSDADGVASVTVDGIQATPFGTSGTWVAKGVPTDKLVTIEATDAGAQSTTTTRTWPSTDPFVVQHAALVGEPSGKLLGHDFVRSAVYRFDPFGAPQNELVAGPSKGSGPALNSTTGMSVIGSVLYFDTGSATLAIDLATGDRAPVAGCTFPSGSTGFVAVANPLTYFKLFNDGVWSCPAGAAAASVFATLPSGFGAWRGLAYDAVNGRILVGGNQTGGLVAVPLPAGAPVTTLQMVGASFNDRVDSLTALDGQPYFMTYHNALFRTTPDLAGEALTTLGFNLNAGLTPCPGMGQTTALCANTGGAGVVRAVKMGGAWSAQAIPTLNPVGSGAPPATSSVIVVPEPGGAFAKAALYTGSSGLYRIDLDTGVRSLVSSASLGVLSNVLPSGRVVTANGQWFDAHATPLVPAPIPGLPGYLGAFDVAPAGVLLPGDAVVWFGSNALHVTDIVTGADTLLPAPPDYPVSISVSETGTIYVGSGGAIWSLAKGAAAATLLITVPGVQVQNNSMHYDAEHHTLLVGYGGSSALVDTVAATSTPVSSFDFDLPMNIYGWRRGPVPGTVVAPYFGLNQASVVADYHHGSGAILAH